MKILIFAAWYGAVRKGKAVGDNPEKQKNLKK